MGVDPMISRRDTIQHNHHEGWAAIRYYANQTVHSLLLLCRRPNFTSTYRGAFSATVQLRRLIVYSTSGDWMVGVLT